MLHRNDVRDKKRLRGPVRSRPRGRLLPPSRARRIQLKCRLNLPRRLRQQYLQKEEHPRPHLQRHQSLLPGLLSNMHRRSAAPAKSFKVTAIAVAQSQVADAQRTVELLTSTAAKKKFNAEDKKACYFEDHAHALELAIDREDTGLDLNAALDDANGDLPTLEYEYRFAGEEANRAETAAATATNELQKLTRRLEKITPKGPPEIKVADKCVIIQPSEFLL
ncbi:unnamed protein product [Peronospora effusa]|nr:unnamed protein product [Peronospora effusa]